MVITIVDHYALYPSWAMAKDIDIATKMSSGPEAKLLKEPGWGECELPSQLKTSLPASGSCKFWCVVATVALEQRKRLGCEHLLMKKKKKMARWFSVFWHVSSLGFNLTSPYFILGGLVYERWLLGPVKAINKYLLNCVQSIGLLFTL